MISQHHFNNALSLTAAQALKTWADENLIDDDTITNPYLEPVNIPTYSASEETHCLIPDDAPCVSDTFNDTQWTHFYIRAGHYGYTTMAIIRSGIDTDNRCTISLYEDVPTDLHPAQMDSADLAEVRFEFTGASFWTIDRMAWNRTGSQIVSLYYGATYNIINRMYTNDNGNSVEIKGYSHNNTIQNCRLGGMSKSASTGDNVGIQLVDWGGSNGEIFNTKIINNEMRNQNDAIQGVRQVTTVGGGDYQGTIIDSNHMWVDTDFYMSYDYDLGEWVYDVNGIRSITEDAIDLKIGSEDANNPIIITNNHMWGYRQTVSNPVHISGSAGGCVGGHYGVKNIIIEDNVCFDSAYGVAGGDGQEFPYACENWSIKRNLFYSVGNFGNNESVIVVAVGFADENNSIIAEDNVIVDGRYQAAWYSNTYNSIFRNNVIINQAEAGIGGGNNEGNTIIIPNTWYTTAEALAEGYTEDYTFTTDNFTNNPRQITLPNVLKG